MNDTPNSLKESPWANATVVGGDLADTVNKLTSQDGPDRVRGRHARARPDRRGGSGLPVFRGLGTPRRFRFVTSTPFECGIAALHLQPERS